MSQAKVDRYKEEKANRKQNMKKAKVESIVRKCIFGVVGIALIGWIGFSVARTYEKNQPAESVEIDYNAVDSFQSDLSTDSE